MDGKEKQPGNQAGSEAQKRKQFYDAAEPLLERYGYRKTTVEDICRTAGASKRTFYDLFQDKKDLLIRMIADLMEEEVVNLRGDLDQLEDPADQLVLFMNLYTRLIVDRPIFRLFITDPSLWVEIFSGFDLSDFDAFMNTLQIIITRGVEMGRFRQIDPYAGAMIFSSIMDSMYVLLPSLFNLPGAGQDPKLDAEVRKFILSGMGVKDV